MRLKGFDITSIIAVEEYILDDDTREFKQNMRFLCGF